MVQLGGYESSRGSTKKSPAGLATTEGRASRSAVPSTVAVSASAHALLRTLDMERQELVSLAFDMLADAVGDLLREDEDPAGYVFTAAHADSPLGEMLLQRHATAGEDAVCVMLPIDALSRVLESYAFDPATGARLAAWLATASAPSVYRVVAIGRDGLAAVTIDTSDEDIEEAPASLVRH